MRILSRRIWLLALAPALAQQIGAAKEHHAGEVLAATEKSRDPDLARSVVLLIYADREGVMGLILNQPSGKAAYFGGPIAMGMRWLVPSKTKPAGAERILDGVWMVSKDPGGGQARAYAGYVGWSAEQLNGEIARGLWKIVAGDRAMVFDRHPETLWRRVAR